MGQLDWNALGVLIGLATAIIAVISLYIQTRQASRLAQIELITHLVDQYSSDEFLQFRAEAAKILLKAERPDGLNNDLDQVLGFYEFLGLLSRQKVISEFLLWHSFSSDMFYYMEAARDYISWRHNRNIAVYADVLVLDEKMRDIEKKEAGEDSSDLHLSPEDVKSFLESESKAYEIQKKRKAIG